MEKEQLIEVFDTNAISYDKYRPGYPSELIEEIIELSQIKARDKILEIGCGTGQITIEFVKRGYEVIAIERGKALSRLALQKIEPFKIGKIVRSNFEDWTTLSKFKTVISAQAFHWIEKVSGISKILQVLEENGSIGLIWNVDESHETDFWKKTSKIYEKYLPVNKGLKTMAETVEEHWDYIRQRKELTNFEKRAYKWKKTYTKEGYLGLLSTFSPHMSLEPATRRKLFREIESIIESGNNQVTRQYKTVLLFANKQG